MKDGNWQWSVASDSTVVHALIKASDRRSATEFAPAPHRNVARTSHLVAAGAVQLLDIDGRPAATITLVEMAPFELKGIPFDKVERPVYMQRFSVDDWAIMRFGALPAIATLRRAREIAGQMGGEALRCEINPDIVTVRTLLSSFGFHEVGKRSGHPARAYMQHSLVL